MGLGDSAGSVVELWRWGDGAGSFVGVWGWRDEAGSLVGVSGLEVGLLCLKLPLLRREQERGREN